MAGVDTERFKDKIEVSLDGRQVFYLFFGGAIITTLVFVLGVMVGRRVESRTISETLSPSTDPLAALDQLDSDNALAFPAALRGKAVALGAIDENWSESATATSKTSGAKPATGGPLKPEESTKASKAAETARLQNEKTEEKNEGNAEVEETTDKVVNTDKPMESKTEAKTGSATVNAAPKPPRFTLQVGSFQDKSEADQFFKELSSSYDPYMVEADVPGKGTYYRVRVGRYRDFEEAVAAKEKFEEARRVIAYVTRLGKPRAQ